MIDVLLIEANPTLAWLYREELEDAGFKVRVCRDENQALSALKTKPAHILVTDDEAVRGNVSNWLECVRRIHQGGVVLLGKRPRGWKSQGDLRVIDKSSDMTSLINSLRGQAIRSLWFNLANA